MLAPSELRKFANACISISNQCVDESGFVPMRNLLRRFNARIVFRPLLVEGMLATSIEEGGKMSWTVLIDSEKFKQNQDDLNRECSETPLPSRLRNTIAHELVHSLAFRHSEFSIELQRSSTDKQSRAELVKDIESETERFSPLLLWAESSFSKLIVNTKHVVTIDDLVTASKKFGLSRFVLVSRFELLKLMDSTLLGTTQIRDFAVGVGEWSKDGSALLKKWPIFVHFDKGLVPEFLVRIQQTDNFPISSVFQDRSFVVNGGTSISGRHDSTIAGERIEVELSVEPQARKPGATFLYTVHRISNSARDSRIDPSIAARFADISGQKNLF